MNCLNLSLVNLDVTVLFKIVGLGLKSFSVPATTEVAAVTLPGFSVAYPASFGVAVSNQRAGSAVVLNFLRRVGYR